MYTVRATALLTAFALLGCPRTSPDGAAVDAAGSATTPVATVRPADDAWARSDALKPTLLPDLAPDQRAFMSERVVKITPEDSPFLADGKMFVAERTARPGEEMVHHPSFFHVAQLPGKGARGLHVDADWDWLRTNARVVLDTEPRRIAFVSRYVDVLRSAGTRYAWTVKSVDELQLLTSTSADAMPRASSEAAAEKARILLAKYRDVIKPLALPGDTAPWHGTLYANGRHQLIVKVDVTLEADGRIALTDTVLEKDAPIPGVFP